VAFGGVGGKRPTAGTYVDLNGITKKITADGPGHGNDAHAESGRGGDGGFLLNGNNKVGCALGGYSGEADAVGGPDGDGVSNSPMHAGANPPIYLADYKKHCGGAPATSAQAAGR
jgi:hypothetical protein